jgi:hypothetical protein
MPDLSTSSMLVITLVIVERNPGVCLEACFALAAEDPDHDADERSDKDKKVDCRSHDYHLAIILLSARTAPVNLVVV